MCVKFLFAKKLINHNIISLLKLAENLTFSDKIQPIALPENELDVGSEVIVSGWGSTWVNNDHIVIERFTKY